MKSTRSILSIKYTRQSQLTCNSASVGPGPDEERWLEHPHRESGRGRGLGYLGRVRFGVNRQGNHRPPSWKTLMPVRPSVRGECARGVWPS